MLHCMLHSGGRCGLNGAQESGTVQDCSVVSGLAPPTAETDVKTIGGRKVCFAKYQDLRKKRGLENGECSLRLLLPSIVGHLGLLVQLVYNRFFPPENFILRTDPSRVESMFIVHSARRTEWKWALEGRGCCACVWTHSGGLRLPLAEWLSPTSGDQILGLGPDLKEDCYKTGQGLPTV